MANTIKFPFFGISLNLTGGGNIMLPISEPSTLFFNKNIKTLTKNFQAAFQKQIIDQGAYEKLLSIIYQGDFFKENLTIKINASEDKISYPEFELSFDYYYNKNENGHYWAILPLLQIETVSESLATLEDDLIDAIRIDFMINKRLAFVQEIISLLLYDSVELLQHEIKLTIHSPSELDKLADSQTEKILDKVAKVLKEEKQVLYGRSKEIETLSNIASGKFNKNIVVVGATMSGKTTLIKELARRHRLAKKEKIWETNASLLIKELTNDDGWQYNLDKLCKELKESGDFLFVRNLRELFEVGQYEGNNISMGDYLLSYISQGMITLISECSAEEIADIDLKNPNFLQYFNTIKLPPLKNKELVEIIDKKVKDISQFNKVKIEKEAILETIRLNKRYTPYAGLPGKPIRFLESIVLNSKKRSNTLDRKTILRYFSEESGMPLFMIDPEIPMQPQDVTDFFKQQLFGQDIAIKTLTQLLTIVKTSLSKTEKPIASLLFVGPTGVGKTELAKLLAQFMFGDRSKMIRFDMSEFASPYSVMRLTQGINGQDGLLATAVRQEPFSVLLFDELEKADPSFNEFLLQILGDGRLTDTKGQVVNFCSTIIIMTSNIGASKLQSNKMSFVKNTSSQSIIEHFDTAAKKFFRPEIYNRIDQIVSFSPLTQDVIRHVVKREIDLLKKREGIKYRNLSLQISPQVYHYLSKHGYNEKYGARQLQRVLREKIVIPLAKVLNSYYYEDLLNVSINIINDKVEIQIVEDEQGLDILLEKLRINEQIEEISYLRRETYQLQESTKFIEFSERLHKMKEALKKPNEKFWLSDENKSKFEPYLSIEKELFRLTREIENLEKELGLYLMDLTPYRQEIINELKDWRKDFSAFKTDFLDTLMPNTRDISFFFTGKNVAHILSFYINIALQNEFQLKAVLYYEASDLQKDNATEEDSPLASYETLEITIDNTTPLENQLLKKNLLGAKLEIHGKLAQLFFEDEYGYQKWADNPKDIHIYNISEDIDSSDYPLEDLPRKYKNYKSAFRRVFDDEKIIDNLYNIRREVKASQRTAFISEVLQDAFRNKIIQQLT